MTVTIQIVEAAKGAVAEIALPCKWTVYSAPYRDHQTAEAAARKLCDERGWKIRAVETDQQPRKGKP